MQVKQFNVKKSEEELKRSPRIVQQYVTLLKSHWDHQKSLTQKAIRKLRQFDTNAYSEQQVLDMLPDAELVGEEVAARTKAYVQQQMNNRKTKAAL